MANAANTVGKQLTLVPRFQIGAAQDQICLRQCAGLQRGVQLAIDSRFSSDRALP